MKTLVLHQPYPMGNYKLNEYISNYFSKKNYETYLLQQLNGAKPDAEYVQQIIDLDPDVIYFEMVDLETFKIIEQMSCEKILLQASNGVLSTYEDIFDYYGKWYTKIITNSNVMYKSFLKKNIPCEFFKYYFSPLSDIDLGFKDKYNHDCVFLGMGFHRMTSDSYKADRDIFFNGFEDPSIDFKIYGNGWPQFKHYGGLLPPDDIGKLYSSANCGFALIGETQRNYGQINNRYTEMGYCTLPIITQNYDSIDWYGIESYLNFASTRDEAYRLIVDIKRDATPYLEKSNKIQIFMRAMHTEFFEKLDNLMET